MQTTKTNIWKDQRSAVTNSQSLKRILNPRIPCSCITVAHYWFSQHRSSAMHYRDICDSINRCISSTSNSTSRALHAPLSRFLCPHAPVSRSSDDKLPTVAPAHTGKGPLVTTKRRPSPCNKQPQAAHPVAQVQGPTSSSTSNSCSRLAFKRGGGH